MKLFGRKVQGIPKALVVLVAIFLLSSGLCGITTSIEQSHGWGWMGPGTPNTPLGNAVGFFSVVGLVGLAGSVLGIGLLLLVWPIIAISDRLYGKSNEPDRLQRLCDKEDAVDKDDPL